MPQDYVWLTGSFNGWPASEEDGAIPLTLDPDLPLWTADVPLSEIGLISYKYLMGWADNPGPEWVTQEWDFGDGSHDTVLLLDCGTQHCDGEPTFLVKPWFQWPAADHFVLRASTDLNLPLTFSIDFGDSQIQAQTEPAKPHLMFPVLPLEDPKGYFHELRVEVPPGATSVKVSTVSGPQFSSTVTLPAAADQLTVAVFGDTRTNPDKHLLVANAAADANPDLVIITGDLIAEGLSLKQWELFLQNEEPNLSGSFLLPVYGNHDMSGGLGEPYMETWFHTENRYVSGGNYWIDLGLVGLVTIEAYNVEWDDDEPLAWLDWALENLSSKPWLIVAMHQPIYSFSGHEPWMMGREHIEPLLQKHGVDMVVSGHSHLYEHFLVEGIHFFTSGGGGAGLSSVSDGPPEEQHLLVKQGSFHHFMRLDITAETIDGQVINAEDDSVFETFSL